MADVKKYRCCICGMVLIGDYKYTGRCAQHQATEIRASEAALAKDMEAAQQKRISYGRYMVLKKEGKA